MKRLSVIVALWAVMLSLGFWAGVAAERMAGSKRETSKCVFATLEQNKSLAKDYYVDFYAMLDRISKLERRQSDDYLYIRQLQLQVGGLMEKDSRK
ncbi:MAG: hypothetical protein ACJ8C4_05650 [Gemmataceae bacterium]